MKLGVAREAYYVASGTASTITRQLALSGVALIWLLAGGLSKSRVNLTVVLLLAGILMLTAVAVDLAQYFWVAIRFHGWADEREAELDASVAPASEAQSGIQGSDREIGYPPDSIADVAWVLFCTKIGLMFGSYILIMVSLIGHLRIRA